MQERTAGIDLASEEHRLVVVEADGDRLEQRRYPHSEEGVTALVRRLGELGVCRVAIEQPNGLVVDRLLDAGIAVIAVHPNQLAASRDRYRAGGGKSDGFDAYVLAELARTDMHRLRLFEPDGARARSWSSSGSASPTSCGRSSTPSGPAPAGSSRRSTRRSASPSSSASPARRTPAASARSAWPPSSPATATAGARAPSRCSESCARHQWVGPASSSRRLADRSCSRSSPR